ncbi:helix-turn-helix domain-containing protein [Pectobacterium aroidearum]|uniref:helix-turn-helix domain-containing protein n=1 Tax=Pectobacterium aroidearum TaxID=1201031 RepID=UPI001CD3394B|nr:helix-turn-helix domain-containing protein [Pectobacterium aroidearum]
MRLTAEQKAEIIRLKRGGMGYRTIATHMGMKHPTVRSVCQRSGLFADNPAHRAMFSILEPRYSTALATVKPLPPQRVITGHRQTDAYLWVLEVIKLDEPAHLPAAEIALQKLTITPKEAENRYRNWMVSQGQEVFIAAFSTIGMDNPQRCIENARKAIDTASQVRAYYGGYEAAMEPTEPEHLIEQSGLLVDVNYGMTPNEIESGELKGLRCLDVADARSVAHQGFCDVLPEPHTLSDVVREFEYWSWLYTMRNAASKELGDMSYEHNPRVCDREDWLDGKLAAISPIHQQEALAVLKWFLKSDRHQDCDGDNDAVYLNLLGGGLDR